MISERDLTDLCFAGLRPNIREKLEHYEFVNVNQLLQKAISVESPSKSLVILIGHIIRMCML